MNFNLYKNKRLQAAVAVAIAALLVITGAFAWSSFTQQRINVFRYLTAPNVNLHDDFAGGPEKDVYVENSGNQQVLVRVSLTDLLIMGGGILLPETAVDDETGTNWHIHTPAESICEVCDFPAHDYFAWTMDGHKFYMPAHEITRGGDVDGEYIEPLAVGDLDEIIDYAALLRNAFANDTAVLGYIDEYLGGDNSHAAELQSAISELSSSHTVENVRQYDGQETGLTRRLNEVRLTLIPTQIITIEDWLADKPKGNFWVMDTDGWCYWASPLLPGDATGQLLSNVEYQNNYPGDDLIYRINVTLNATTYSGTELNEFFNTAVAEANGGITEQAMLLMLMSSGDYILGENSELYLYEGNGVYRQILKNENDSYAGYSVSEPVYAGPDGIIGTDDDMTTFDVRHFYHIGSGVYVEVSDADDTIPIEEPITYYFTGEAVTPGGERIAISEISVLPNTIEEAINAYFPLQLTVDETFGLLIGEDANGNLYIERIDPDGTEYIMQELGEDGNGLYIMLGDDGQISSVGGVLGGSMTDGTFILPKPTFENGVYKIKNRADMDWLTAQLVKGVAAVASASFEVVGTNGVLDMGGSPFIPIGNNAAEKRFTGTFDGKKVPIENLTIDRGTKGNTGLFGYIGVGGTVQNVELVDANVTGGANTGGIAGWNEGTVTGCAVTGDGLVSGSQAIGGIVGYNGAAANLNNSYNTASVTGTLHHIGGIVGRTHGTVERCYVDLTGGNGKAVRGPGVVGGVVGHFSGTLKDCYMWGDVVGGIVEGDSAVGGVIGNNLNSDYTQAFNIYHAKGTVSGGIRVGGVLGNRNGGHMTNAVALSTDIVGTATTNRVVGSSSNIPVYLKNIYAWTGTTVNGATVTAGDAHGADVASQTPTWNWWTTTAKFTVDAWAMPGDLPILRWQAPDWVPDTGYSTDPTTNVVTIYNAAGLSTLRNLFNDVMYKDLMNSLTYKLNNDIDLGGVSWEPISKGGSFILNTTFDGNGYTITGLNVQATGDYAGLFGAVGADGVVKNLKLDNITVNGINHVGGVVGENNGGEVIGCVTTGTVHGTGYNVGGIVGHNVNGGKATDSHHIAGLITINTDNVGGIVGFNDENSTVEGCTNDGEVKNIGGGVYTGGIVGQNKNSTVTQCENTGEVTGGNSTGGVVGYNVDATIQNSHNAGTVMGAAQTGGIVGTNASGGMVTGCYNSNSVNNTGTSGQVGGIAGNNGGTVKNSGNSGNVTGDGSSQNIGGVVGNNQGGTLETSFNTGEITGSGYSVGGVAGSNHGTIANCYAWGNVNGALYAGGVVGQSSSSSSLSYSYHSGGRVKASISGIGGIVGRKGINTSVTNCVANADTIESNSATNVNYAVGLYDAIGTGTVANNFRRAGSWIINQNAGLDVPTVSQGDIATQAWWTTTGPGFNDAIWRWDDMAKLPVLIGVTPDGSEDNPYRISSRADLDWMSAQVNGVDTFNGKHFKLMNDIDMGDTLFMPIGSSGGVNTKFQGTFDGNRKTISNLKVNNTSGTSSGLFSTLGETGVIKNLTLRNTDIIGVNYAAAVAGYCAGTITRVTVKDSKVTGDIYVGGITGVMSGTVGGTIEDCHFIGTGNTVHGNDMVGGITGRTVHVNSKIVSCTNSGAITGNLNVGGIVGWNEGKVQSCTNTGSPAKLTSGGGGTVTP